MDVFGNPCKLMIIGRGGPGKHDMTVRVVGDDLKGTSGTFKPGRINKGSIPGRKSRIHGVEVLGGIRLDQIKL